MFRGGKMKKNEIRREVKCQTLALDAKQRLGQSLGVVERVGAIIAQRKSQTVALFSPLNDEVQIAQLVDELTCRVVLPRVEGDGMEFYDYHAGELAQGAYGIAEPQDGELCLPQEIDLMVVPGVAFTPSGDRLGRGKGYYDRYLAREGFRAYCVGVCYAHQLLTEIPTEPHDKRMDMVVSGNEL